MANNIDASSSDEKDSVGLHTHMKTDTNHASPEFSVSDAYLVDSTPPTVAQLIKDKNREWEDIKSKGIPLALLDLPVDVLRLILTYTNDLIAVALTHSALYKLAVPNIYSRFDIVWPDSSTPNESSKSVDALSYGLATLSLPSRFAESVNRWRGAVLGQPKASHRLANNEYAKYIRKFSIGDGPSEWTSEYLINKESGKMLGTLVAIAISKMANLESFVWDMPTGVLSDVFMALSSLEDDQGQAKLEKVWVRWHDNSSTTPGSSSASSPTTTLPPFNPPPPHPPIQTFPAPLPGVISNSVGNYVSATTSNAAAQPKSYAQSCVEYPTFSILPPLKSLTVLEIDDISYLDEMSVLIERSASRLKELRVGISKTAYKLHDFAQPWDGANLQQVDYEANWPGESRIPTTRLGGVLGVLVGRIHDIRRKSNPKSHEESASEDNTKLPKEAKTLGSANKDGEVPQPRSTVNGGLPDSCSDHKRLDAKLKLETLALERVTLSIAVCSRAIDWRNMTSLTILGCRHHDALWKALRRQYQPTPPAHGSPPGALVRYHLSLKHISTDLASPALISFMKETIAPNTMESIFLQDRQHTVKPSVTLEQVFKCTVKRHRNSLKKLLIDSSEDNSTSTAIIGTSGRWRHWAIRDEFFSYITSGRMTSLRELGMVIDLKDWHTLLQQLPQMANLRSLYIPQMVDRASRPTLAPKELALQIVDIISLRREVQLTYVGLWHKCFEITEAEHGDSGNNRFQDDNDHAISVDDVDHMDGNSEGEEETDEDEDDVNEPWLDTDDEVAEEASDDGQSEADSFVEATTNSALPRLRLREILYYDDKVELFRARHGKL
ncbi:hypothetical protein NUW58_g8340 [Xylaria curta]|uniref:Uncharacterized protein n=1 Tax=Xylaria curta TaxID=42375 RepID=A0ACC1N938_9PEZI|nr:hypothetical protein NUW58_g8340 [Xylaria curta]